jgi:ATP-binding protein involved in chromosome partitioning
MTGSSSPGEPPRSVDVDRAAGVTLEWEDGTTTRLALEPLRQHCPCAECRTRREAGRAVWPLPSSPRPLAIVDAEIVGGWGLGITWNDGHRTGIYSWELLRGA